MKYLQRSSGYEDVGILTLGILMASIIIGGFIGYTLNILAIFHTVDMTLTGKLLLRLIGIIAFPIGAILGWL